MIFIRQTLIKSEQNAEHQCRWDKDRLKSQESQ